MINSEKMKHGKKMHENVIQYKTLLNWNSRPKKKVLILKNLYNSNYLWTKLANNLLKK
jgi:hypothetical protein